MERSGFIYGGPHAATRSVFVLVFSQVQQSTRTDQDLDGTRIRVVSRCSFLEEVAGFGYWKRVEQVAQVGFTVISQCGGKQQFPQ